MKFLTNNVLVGLKVVWSIDIVWILNELFYPTDAIDLY